MAICAKMFAFCSWIFSLLWLIGFVACDGKYQILHAPTYMKFLEDASAIDLSEIPLVLKNSFGFSTESDIKWNGMVQNDPFKRPKSQVIFSVEGLHESLPAGSTFDLNEDAVEVDTGLVSDHLKIVMNDQSVIADFSQDDSIRQLILHHPSVFGSIPTSSSEMRAILTSSDGLPFAPQGLNVSVKEDAQLLTEIYLIYAIVDAVKLHGDVAKDSFPDFYHFKIDGLRAVTAKHGLTSAQVKEATRIIERLLNKVTDVFTDVYGDNTLIQLVQYDVNHQAMVQLRLARSLQADMDMEFEDEILEPFEDRANVEDGFVEHYDVIFNIILWLMIILALTVLMVSVGIWNMDPGHDSIIYRMTSQRLKRD